MARNSSATPREEKSTPNQISRQLAGGSRQEETSTPKPETQIPHQETSTPHEENSIRASRSCADETSAVPFDASLKRRARLLITNASIPTQTRSMIRYALEIKDPYLDQVVRRVEAGEMIIDYLYIK